MFLSTGIVKSNSNKAVRWIFESQGWETFFYDCEGNLFCAAGALECGGPAPLLDNDPAIAGYLASPGSAGRLTGFIDCAAICGVRRPCAALDVV